MSISFFDPKEARRQLDLYFEVDSVRASLLCGDRARQWEEECREVFHALQSLFQAVQQSQPAHDILPWLDRATYLVADMQETPHFVVERGLRPETAAQFLATLTRLQATLIPLRVRLGDFPVSYNTGGGSVADRLQRTMDRLTIPTARLAAHVNALAAVYDLLMVRPALRTLEDWLFTDTAYALHDDDSFDGESDLIDE